MNSRTDLEEIFPEVAEEEGADNTNSAENGKCAA
jgi:hypothetical protein